MSKFLHTANSQALPLKLLPILPFAELRDAILLRCREGARPLAFFGMQEDKGLRLIVALAEDEASYLELSSAIFSPNEKSFESLTPERPSFSSFEREFYEEWGIEALGHPWLKPLRYPKHGQGPRPKMKDYPFFKLEGEEVHEVAVGPVHAGVIEPGHFRFMCTGESVHHLEIQLGYQHRGIEEMLRKGPIGKKACLIESIAGDSVIANMSAHAEALEALSAANIPDKALNIRGAALEMERAALHIGNLSALANDVAYLPGNSAFGAIRTLVINSTMAICGSRFGHSLVRPGGVLFDIPPALAETVRNTLRDVLERVILASETMFDSPTVLSRFQKTGIVPESTAREIGLVGLAARASGLSLDVRSDHPTGIYRYFPVHKLSLEDGDVYSRAYMRYLEIQKSLQFAMEQLECLKDDGMPLITPIGPLQPDALVISLVEGSRGEMVHCVITDKDAGIRRYKIKDPSFNNWFGLALAVRGQGVSDFPLCNKSFDLSYCGHDL